MNIGLDIESILKNIPVVDIDVNWNKIYILLEKFNICWNIKVKPVYWMVKNALQRWQLNKNKIILEASSWNTGISLAFVWKIFGIKTIIILPSSTAPCKKKLIKSFWAEIVEVEGNTEDAIKKRDEIYLSDKNKYWIPDQFTNWDNFWSHYWLTAETVLEKVWKEIDFFIAGLGTSWTLLGTWKRLKEVNSKINIIWVNPIDKIEWLRNFKQTYLSIPFYEEYKDLIDEIIDLRFDEAIEWVRWLLQKGYFCWISSGAIFQGLIKYLNNKIGLKWVMVAPDGWDMYLDVLTKYLDCQDFKGCK